MIWEPERECRSQQLIFTNKNDSNTFTEHKAFVFLGRDYLIQYKLFSIFIHFPEIFKIPMFFIVT